MCGTLHPSSVVPWTKEWKSGKDSGTVVPQVARTCDEKSW